MALVALTIISIIAALRYNPNVGKTHSEDSDHTTRNRRPQILFTLLMLGIVMAAALDGFKYETMGRPSHSLLVV